MRLKVSSHVHSFPHWANVIEPFPGLLVCVCVCVCVVFLRQMSRETYWSTEVMFQEFASLQHTDYTQQSPRSVSYRRSNTHNRNWSPSQFSLESNTVYRWLTSEIAWKLGMWPQFSLSKSASPPYAFFKKSSHGSVRNLKRIITNIQLS